jgi:hypothetical protein
MAWPIELQGCLLMFGVVAIAASVAALTLAAAAAAAERGRFCATAATGKSRRP